MKTIRTAIELSLLGNISAQSAGFAQSLSRLESTGRRSLLGIAGAANRTHSALGTVFNRGTALIGSVGLGISGKSIADLQTRLTRLRIQAGISKEEMAKFNQELYKTAQSRDINISTGELLSAIEKIVSKTGDMKFAADNMKNFAYAISATGAAGQDVGALGADLMEKFGIKDQKEIIATMGLLVNQGKAGAFELRDLASQGERVTAAYASTGRMGKTAVTEMGAMLQMARKASGSPEQTATSLEALIRNFNDPNKRKILTGNGIKIMDPEDPKRMRSLIDISKDLIKTTKGDTSKIGRVIDQEGLRALMAMIIEFKQTGGFKSVDEFLTTSSDPQALLDDSKEVAQTLSSAMMSLSTAVNYFAESNLAKPIQLLADAINNTDPSTLQSYLQYTGMAIGGLAAIWAGSKVIGMGASALALLGGGNKTGTSIAGSFGNLASMARPLPVFVVNNGAGGFGNIAGSMTVAGGRWGGLLKATGRLGAIGAAGYGLYSAYNADDNTGRGEGLGMALGGAIGLLGGPLGVMIGTYAGQKLGGYFGGLVDDFQKAQNGEEIGKIIGRELSKITKIIPGADMLYKYSEAAAEKLGGFLGQFFDHISEKQEQKETTLKAREQSTLHKISNEINLVIDDQGARLVRKNTTEPQQTKINVDLGFTRIPDNAI